MIKASTEIDAAEDFSISGGTPAIFARLRENMQIGTNPTDDRISMPAVPVLNSRFVVSKSPLPVASATYF
jgi:hypothetical protein